MNGGAIRKDVTGAAGQQTFMWTGLEKCLELLFEITMY